MRTRLVVALACCLGILMVSPAQASYPVTFYTYGSSVSYPNQTQTVGGAVNLVNRDSMRAHRLVAYENTSDSASQNWSLDVTLGVGDSHGITAGEPGNYYFRDPNHSTITHRTYSWAPGRVFTYCSGMCGRLSVRY